MKRRKTKAHGITPSGSSKRKPPSVPPLAAWADRSLKIAATISLIALSYHLAALPTPTEEQRTLFHVITSTLHVGLGLLLGRASPRRLGTWRISGITFTRVRQRVEASRRSPSHKSTSS